MARRKLIKYEEALNIISKQDLESYYLDQNNNKLNTADHFGIYPDTLNKLLDYYELKKSKEQIKQSKSKTYFENTGYLWPTQNKEVLQKREIAWKSIYGENHPNKSKQIQEKRRQTCIEKYGEDHPFKIDYIASKRTQTMNNKPPEELDAINQKRKDTQREKYGGKLYFETQQYQEARNKTLIQRYGSLENAHQIQYQHYVETMNQKYGVNCSFQLPQWRTSIEEKRDLIEAKKVATFNKNHTWNTSKPEEDYYKKLISLYGEEDVFRNYNKDSRYPYCCDFYIKSQDLFIELNLHWTHGGMIWDPKDQKCIDQLEEWKIKAESSKYYKHAIYVWTELDYTKIQLAVKNKLNYRVIYDKSQL